MNKKITRGPTEKIKAENFLESVTVEYEMGELPDTPRRLVWIIVGTLFIIVLTACVLVILV